MKKQEKIWISVDGGGTKTMFCACDSSGNTLYAEAFGHANYKSAGLEAVSDILTSAFSVMLRQLGRRVDDIAGVVMAIAGCDTEQDEQIYREMMKTTGIPQEKIVICNDTEIVFRALTDRNGICVVAGTGSIVCAYDANGLVDRVGGWGAVLSDLGSGYWIGSEILRKMICWLDGMEEETLPIYEEIKERFFVPEVELAWLLAELPVTETASISPLVFKYARQGDAVCCAIIEKAADWIIKQIVVLCKKVDYKEAFPLVAVGGLFNDEQFRKTVEMGVRSQFSQVSIEFLRPVNSPAEDGLVYARKIFQQG